MGEWRRNNLKMRLNCKLPKQLKKVKLTLSRRKNPKIALQHRAQLLWIMCPRAYGTIKHLSLSNNYLPPEVQHIIFLNCLTITLIYACQNSEAIEPHLYSRKMIHITDWQLWHLKALSSDQPHRMLKGPNITWPFKPHEKRWMINNDKYSQ